MKKLLSLLLIVMLVCASVVCANAEGFEITDEFLDEVREEYDNSKIEKDDINIIKVLSLDEYRHIVQYDVDGYEYTDDIYQEGFNNYILTSSRPEPVYYYNGRFINLKEAHVDYFLRDEDIEAMYNSGLFSMEKTKIHLDLLNAMDACSDDQYINVSIEMVGADIQLEDIENWHDDVQGAWDEIKAHYEALHQKLLTDVLKDVDYIDRAHQSGVSIISLKKADIEKISQDDSIVLMGYISDVRMRYIEKHNAGFVGVKYQELVTEYNDDGTKQYTVLNAHGAGAYEVVVVRIGNSVLWSGESHGWGFRSGYGLYDYAEDKFVDLEDIQDSYEQYTNLEKNLLECGEAMPVADTDNDSKVTVMDATNIQRFLAKLDYVNIKFYKGDMDKDGKITTLDATLIQKLVAKI